MSRRSTESEPGTPVDPEAEEARQERPKPADVVRKAPQEDPVRELLSPEEGRSENGLERIKHAFEHLRHGKRRR